MPATRQDVASIKGTPSITQSLFCACRKTTGALKIVHEKYDRKKNDAAHEAYRETFNEAVKYNEALRQHLPKVADDLNPLRVQVRGLGGCVCCMCVRHSFVS